MLWRDQLYIDMALPFGLRSAPKIFKGLLQYFFTAVVIGFANTSLEFMEAGGPAQRVCVEVTVLGLGLDPFNRVPLNINANGKNLFIFRPKLTCLEITFKY